MMVNLKISEEVGVLLPRSRFAIQMTLVWVGFFLFFNFPYTIPTPYNPMPTPIA